MRLHPTRLLEQGVAGLRDEANSIAGQLLGAALGILDVLPRLRLGVVADPHRDPLGGVDDQLHALGGHGHSLAPLGPGTAARLRSIAVGIRLRWWILVGAVRRGLGRERTWLASEEASEEAKH